MILLNVAFYRNLLICMFLMIATFSVFSQTVINPTHDTYIRSGSNSDDNYGEENELRIKATDNSDYYRKVLLQFDLSDVTIVEKAVLRLYVNSTKSSKVMVYQTTDNWDETTVSWNRAPTVGDSISSQEVKNEGIYYEWNVSDFVKQELAGNDTASFFLDDIWMTATNVIFNSKESGSNLPELVITEESESYTSLPVSEDAKVYYWGTSKHVKNYGSSTDISIKMDGAVKGCIDSYLKFDISEETQPREKVLLQLYADSISRSTWVSVYSTSDQDSWSENDISGYNKSLANERLGLFAVSSTGFVSFNITDVYNKAVSNNQTEFSLVLKDSEGAFVSFYSKEQAINQPELLLSEQTTSISDSSVLSGTFYLDAENGNDTNSGTSAENAWQNISLIKDFTFAPGTIIKLKRGSEWTGQQLRFKGSGTENAPIQIEAYGTGEKPSLNGDGQVNEVIQLFNQEYIEISDLAISNWGTTMDAMRRGIYVLADDFGVVHHLSFTGLDITDINGTDGQSSGVYDDSDDAKRTGGIVFEVRGDKIKTYYDGLLVDQCFFYNCSNAGCCTASHWTELNFDSDWSDNLAPGTTEAEYVHNFVPSKNILIKRNRFDHIQTQGLIIRTAEDPVLEYNLFYYCSVGEGSDNACFNSKTTGALWRYNEACYTQYTDGQGDGAGIDSDIRSKNTTIEYNYCHNNGYGGIITTGGRFSTSFNDSTVIRYNILANNGHNSVRLCNNNTNAQVYNNLVYYNNSEEINRLVFQHLHNDTPIGPTNTSIFNNIFYTTANNGRFMADVDWSDSRVERCYYSHNLFVGIDPEDQCPDDANKVTDDPLFVDGVIPDQEIGGYVLLNEEGIPTGEVDPEFLAGFRLQENSPLIDAGTVELMLSVPTYDFSLIEVPLGEGIDIGPYEFDPTLTGVNTNLNEEKAFALYPNPATTFVNLRANSSLDKLVVKTMLGREVFQMNAINQKEYKVQVNDFSSGIYFFSVIDELGNGKTFKVIIN